MWHTAQCSVHSGRTGAGLSQMFLEGEEDHTHYQNMPAALVRVEPEMLISGVPRAAAVCGVVCPTRALALSPPRRSRYT